MIKISGSIVIYNENKETLKRIIENFLSLEYTKELIVIDNSLENTLEAFCNEYKDIRYLHSKVNLGFGAGHNLAFKNLSKSSDIHLIVNPDVYFNVDNINKFLKWFYTSKDISLAIPMVLNPDGSIQSIVRKIPTPWNLISRRIGLSSGEINIEKNEINDIPFAHGCFMTFKTAIFAELDGFDERFFMYMEDIDIFIRAKQFGRTVINSNYEIYHEYRKGSSKSIRLLVWHIVSAVKFFLKYGIIKLYRK